MGRMADPAREPGPGVGVASSMWFSGSATKARVRDLLSGMAAGFVAKAVEYPFDTLKVILQVRLLRQIHKVCPSPSVLVTHACQACGAPNLQACEGAANHGRARPRVGCKFGGLVCRSAPP